MGHIMNTPVTHRRRISHSANSYLRQGGYVFIGVFLFVCLSAGLRKNYSTDFHQIRMKGGTRTMEETGGFGW